MNRVRTVGGVTLITLLSRVTGYARDKVLALVLGAGMQADAFIVAFRIPNLFRALLAEGALHAAFIPVFSESRNQENSEDLWKFAAVFLYSLTFILTAITVAGIVFSPWIVSLFAREFILTPGKFELTVMLNRVMFPYLFLISLAGLFQGILNAHDRFYLPAATPIFLNLSMIVCGLLLGRVYQHPTLGFATGVFVGGVLQMGSQLVVARRLGLSLNPVRPFSHPAVWKVLKLMVPGLFVLGIYEINQLVGTRFAASIGDSAVSVLYYAYRVNHLVYGGVVMSLFTVFLPGMSREVKDRDRFLTTLTSGINLGLWVTIPAAAGLWILAEPSIKVLFEGGRFSSSDTLLVAEALGYYALSLPAYAISKMLASAFFAHQNTRTPAVATAIDLLVFTAGCVFLVPRMAQSGIALATSLGGYAQVLVMILFAGRAGISPSWRAMGTEALRIIVASGVMAFVLIQALSFFPLTAGSGIALTLLRLTLFIAAGFALFLVLCSILKVKTLSTLRQGMKRIRS
ncbi:MAG TPA: murein biosynthesis integral membrane protein MurJ [Thermoanaerobaculia bacterium]|nr:murein biosynthesis integral membrane protein MurJ [Thermoanaerobaculia bacterium]HUM28515.1 murein biosynthesis integral membrane protein MurJ [Thermoanaerobaculia bacterium]HXK66877.1 murein biosynthesis integral membrane protein MurJ [Thermoanaerobaculia bacterium]